MEPKSHGILFEMFHMYESPANVFLNSLALCFSLILLTLVLPSVSLFKVSVLQVVEKRGTHSELTSTGVHGSSPVSSVLSRRRLQPADLCGQQVLTSLIQNQESETQVCVKQARKLG